MERQASGQQAKLQIQQQTTVGTVVVAVIRSA